VGETVCPAPNSESHPNGSIVAVIPTYNRSSTLERAIRSVLTQTRPPDEVLVVDDGSTDRTRDLLGAFESVRVLSVENSGAAIARNRGVAATDAPWIAFLDSDDYWETDHLARIDAAIRATDGRAGVYFDDTARPGGGKGEQSLFALSDLSFDGTHRLVDDASDWVLRPRQPMMLQASVFSRNSWNSVGGLWPTLRSRHDTHIFLRLGIKQPMCAVAGTGCHMTDDDTSGNRQMDAMGTRSRGYWEHTVHLYSDVMSRHHDDLAQQDLADLRARLARGHLALARHDIRRPALLLGDLTRAFRADPATAVSPVRRRLGTQR
jgi:glycosyltransferase involved in cell wall biosynthesis